MELETLEIEPHHSKSIKECQILASKKLNAFVEVLMSFLTNLHSVKVKVIIFFFLNNLERNQPLKLFLN